MSGEKKQGGRPVDAAAGRSLKLAALQLVRERGYAKVSIAAIASAAGVARQTLYNRWNTKADLVLDAVFEETGRFSTIPPADTGETCAAQLEAFLVEVFDHLAVDGDPLRALIAAAQEDTAFRTAFRERFVLPREQIVTDLLRRAQARGELGKTRDPEMLSAFVHGAFWYRLLNGQPVDAALARAITAEVFAR
ncbi:TetR-like C-terminal domain-containing protein [Alloyangia pacifica]|uniref:Transcriptional regulator, TetR family n=1 Tax=Alloyangia pacifica TaxID=311180 RepID=A0A1I6RFD9_9RHOB|nr:TetR-like C-terminal domain-containing protein [Alloyangia pacifica]SDG48901.1 transcriptional regulator, TetR family [Alloyangia pacifica]SFS63413.1 transcriptional regulator, TetR family [Alloyangia pacifica]